MAIDHIRRSRGVPAKRGMRVEVDGHMGTITSAAGGYIRVRFDGQKYSLPCHPTWKVRYFGDDGELLMETGDGDTDE